MRGEAACFRLKVRGERLKARSFYRLRSKLCVGVECKGTGHFLLHSKLFYIVARGRGCAIVVIVALARLVVLGGSRGFLGGRNRES